MTDIPDIARLLSPADLPHGMLSSPQISRCLAMGLLVKDYSDSCIRSATYDMRLGATAWRFVNGKRLTFHLASTIDTTREISDGLIFAPNSLTFVTTVEEFNLPCDIIARFNLKSKWVHKGLLLGTAPIVDPEFRGRALLPIHNFSSNIVQMEYGAPVLAVEFTKTLPIEKGYVVNNSPTGKPDHYINSTGAVESAVFKAINRNEALLDSIRNKTKFFSIAGGITLFLLICANMSLLVNIFNTAENARKQAVATQNLIDSFSGKNMETEKAFQADLEKIKLEIQKLKDSGKHGQELSDLQERISELEKHSANFTKRQ